MRKNTFKWILLLFLSVAILYTAYEIHFKFVINDFQISLISDRLEENYKEHNKQFTEISEYVDQFDHFDIEITPNDKLLLSISNVQGKQIEQTDLIPTIWIVEDSIRLANWRLKFKDLQQLLTKSLLFDTLKIPNWRIDYNEKKSSAIGSLLLKYNGIDKQEFQRLDNMLKSVNCSAINKNDQRITIRFKGYKFDGFNYVFPLDATIPEQSSNHLSGNFYWEHYQFELYCEWTDWGWL